MKASSANNKVDLLNILLECSSSHQQRHLLQQYKSQIDRHLISKLKQIADQLESISEEPHDRDFFAVKKDDRQFTWAKIQHILGLIYRYHGKITSDNLEIAIDYYRKALTQFTFDIFPEDWATVQNDLGNAIRSRETGEKKKNIEQAIKHYKNALIVRQKGKYLQRWSDTQYNLGVAYAKLSNLEGNHWQDAITCFKNSLEDDSENNPILKAEIYNAIAVLYQDNKNENYSYNLEQAIEYHQQALEIYQQQRLIKQTASIYDGLGNAYRELSKTENQLKNNLELARQAYEKALQIYNRQDNPVDWAVCQHDLGLVLRELGRIQEAIDRFQLALEIFTPTAFPVECFRVAKNLGRLAFETELWKIAITGFELTVKALEVKQKRDSDQNYQDIDEQTILPFYTYLSEADIFDGQLPKAIETIERSRSRYLTELTAVHKHYESSNLPPKLEKALKQYEKIQEQIYKLQRQYQSRLSSDDDNISSQYRSSRKITREENQPPSLAKLKELEKDIKDLQAQRQEYYQELQFFDRVLAEQIEIPFNDLKQLQQLIKKPTKAILSFYSGLKTTYIFILRQDSIDCHECPNQSRQELQSWLTEQWYQPYLDNRYQREVWIEQMESKLTQLAQRLALEKLVDNHLQGLEELILVPHLLLHQIPFTALPLNNSHSPETSYFGDRFTLRLIPSYQILSFCQQRSILESSLVYGMVIDTQNNLEGADLEGNLISWLHQIPSNFCLEGKQATIEKLRYLLQQEKIQGLLSSHHACFNSENPLESSLELSNGQKITLRDLLTLNWRMPELHEVFLSCCETGLGLPISTNTDDVLTLAGGFLCSGARTVISSLWVVEDGTTTLLSFFYHLARRDGLSRAEALKKAQQRLRGLSETDLVEAKNKRKEARRAMESANSQGNREATEFYQQEHRMWNIFVTLLRQFIRDSRSYPISHPFYWSAFTCQGL